LNNYNTVDQNSKPGGPTILAFWS